MSDYILEMKGIVKEFPGVRALDGVTFSARKGEILALVGENGAGKSTLMKILSGVYPHGTYEGEIVIEGKPQSFASVRDSENAGVAIIFQELALVRQLSVCENIMLGEEISKNGVIDWNASYKKAEEALRRVGLDISPATITGTLGVGHQQLIEIAKALSKNAKILVLDEPTAALSEKEADHLLALMRQLKEKGVTCIYISHRLKEVLGIADRITVLRDGRTVGTQNKSEMTESSLIAKMVGRELKDVFPPRAPKECTETVLSVKNWTVSGGDTGIDVKNVSFEVRKGEIVGMAGLVGSGRTELAMSMFGIWGEKTSGTLEVDCRPVERLNPRDLIRSGVSLASEDRKRWGLVLIHDVKTNITLSALSAIARNGVVNRNEEITSAGKYVKDMAIKTPTLEQRAGNLSGGNQQKIVLSKCLMTRPKVLILDEPTRGIDVGAKFEIYTLIHALAAQGVGILVISSELPEILGLCDRVLVMHDGELAGGLAVKDATQENVMALATGSN